jgi:hypothetical protein
VTFPTDSHVHSEWSYDARRGSMEGSCAREPAGRALVARGAWFSGHFGSDAHEPAELARGFGEAAALVEAHGFRPGRHPYDVWMRAR